MKHILSILACFFFISCTSSRSFSLVSTKVAAVPTHKALGKVEIVSCGTVNFKRMEDKALEQAREMGGDAVMDFQMRHKSSVFVYYFFFVYSRECYSFSGTAVKFAGDGASVWDEAPQPVAKEPKSTWD